MRLTQSEVAEDTWRSALNARPMRWSTLPSFPAWRTGRSSLSSASADWVTTPGWRIVSRCPVTPCSCTARGRAIQELAKW